MAKTKKVVVIDAEVSHYDAYICAESTLTIGELIEMLSEHDMNAPCVLRFSKGYSFGRITEEDIKEKEYKETEY